MTRIPSPDGTPSCWCSATKTQSDVIASVNTSKCTAAVVMFVQHESRKRQRSKNTHLKDSDGRSYTRTVYFVFIPNIKSFIACNFKREKKPPDCKQKRPYILYYYYTVKICVLYSSTPAAALFLCERRLYIIYTILPSYKSSATYSSLFFIILFLYYLCWDDESNEDDHKGMRNAPDKNSFLLPCIYIVAFEHLNAHRPPISIFFSSFFLWCY